MLIIDERKLQAELAEAQKWLDRYPDEWGRIEGVARCLYWLKDPRAEAMFRDLPARYLAATLGATRPSELMTVGNYHRLAGEEEQALRYFVQARDLLQPGVERRNVVRICPLVECHFLLGEYAEVLTLADLLRSMKEKGLRAYPIARLAGARLTGDKAEATTAAEELAAMIKKEKAAIRETAPGLTLWDWYEIAAKDAGIVI